MKVVAFNGSPRKGGNTEICLNLIGEELSKQGIELEIIQVGTRAKPCTACYQCLERGDGHCIQTDEVNGWIDKMVEADGIILASPVYYGGIAGGMKCFLDRSFLRQVRSCIIRLVRQLSRLRRSAVWRPISSSMRI